MKQWMMGGVLLVAVAWGHLAWAQTTQPAPDPLVEQRVQALEKQVSDLQTQVARLQELLEQVLDRQAQDAKREAMEQEFATYANRFTESLSSQLSSRKSLDVAVEGLDTEVTPAVWPGDKEKGLLIVHMTTGMKDKRVPMTAKFYFDRNGASWRYGTSSVTSQEIPQNMLDIFSRTFAGIAQLILNNPTAGT